MRQKDLLELQIKAERCRRNVLRMVQSSGHGHLGGAFSCIDIVTALYFYKMNVKSDSPDWKERDRFILSAGHKCMSQYAVLAEKGFFDKNILDTYGQLCSKIPGHPDMRKLPGIEANTGALGHGLSIATGMALGLRNQKSSSNVYTILGDGELAEGSNWEAAAAAAHYHLSNLTAIVDFNGLQISGDVKKIMNYTPIDKHFEGFGWATVHLDGNNMEEIINMLERLPLDNEKPTVIVAHTIKGKGLSFAENQVSYHYWKPQKEELDCGIQEIEDSISKLEYYRGERS